MTFRDLQKIIGQKEQQQQTTLSVPKNQQQFFEQFKDKPFWIWSSKEEHRQLYHDSKGQCCFNHILPAGPPIKNGVRHSFYDYEKDILDTLEQHRRLYLLKAAGIGASELMLRYMAYLCLKDDKLKDSEMVIVTGPRVQLSVSLVERMKRLFYPTIVFDTKETVIELNNVRIEAFPSHTIETARGLPNVSFILADESDFWNSSEEPDVRAVIERYVPKSDCYVALISTPNRPNGLMDSIRQEPEETCLYKRLYMDYRVALNKLFSAEEVERARLTSPSFEREFCLKFTGTYGNIHDVTSIDRAVALAAQINPDGRPIPQARKSLGIDVGWGSSAMAFCLTQSINSKVHVLFAAQYERPDYDSMLSLTLSLLRDYHKVNQIFIDSSAPEFISGLKRALGERADYLQQIDEIKKRYPHSPDMQYRLMRVQPISFSVNHKRLLSNAKQWLDDERALVAIPEKHESLLTALRTASALESTLDKSATVGDDLYDAWRLSMGYWVYSPQGATK